MSRHPLINSHRLLLALIAMLCLLPSCSLEDDASKFFSDEALENCLSFGTDGIFTLPVNLTPYDLNPRTKSSVKDTAYSINTDSLLDNLKGRSVYFDNGWLYYQVPFKSNEMGILAAVTGNESSYTDSLAPIKSFYLHVSNSDEAVFAEYSVMMIPTRHYHNVFPEFDFFDKPSFSGYILYSQKDGTFIRGEWYKDGLIQDIGLMEKSDRFPAANTKSSDDWWNYSDDPHFELNSIIVTPKISHKDFQSMVDASIGSRPADIVLQPIVTSIDRDWGGGGGDPKSRNLETIYTVSVNIDNCSEYASHHFRFAKGTIFSYEAPLGSDTCLFVCWIGSEKEAFSEKRRISVKVESNFSVTAKYTSSTKNSACYKLMKALNTGGRMAIWDTIIKRFSNEYELSVLSRNRTVYVIKQGSNNKTSFDYKAGTVYDGAVHSHNNSIISIPSSTDIANLLANIDHYANPQDYPFDIITKDGNSFNILMLRIENMKPINHLRDSLLKAGVSKEHLKGRVMKITKDYYEKIFDGKRKEYIENNGEEMSQSSLYRLLKTVLKRYGITYSVVLIKRQKDGSLQFRWGSYSQEISKDEIKAAKNCFTQLTNNE